MSGHLVCQLLFVFEIGQVFNENLILIEWYSESTVQWPITQNNLILQWIDTVWIVNLYRFEMITLISKRLKKSSPNVWLLLKYYHNRTPVYGYRPKESSNFKCKYMFALNYYIMCNSAAY